MAALLKRAVLGRVWALIALVVLLVAGPGVGAQDGSHVRFGVVDGGAGYSDDLDALGVGWEQITFDWRAFQPDSPGDFETDAVDPARLRGGREVVGLIVGLPEWASESGLLPDGLTLPDEDPGNVWAAFVRRLVRAYAPRGVHHWIIGDEPNVRPGEGTVQFAGEVEDYAALLKTAYRAAKAVDPDAVIHAAAMNDWVDQAAGRDPYLARLLGVLAADPDAAANGMYFDVVTLRALGNTQRLSDSLDSTRALLGDLPGKSIWLELNASPTLDPQFPVPDPVFAVTLREQADFLVQGAALGWAAGVERIAVTAWIDDPDASMPWGLLRADGSRRPAFSAYQRLIEWFDPALTVQRYSFPAEYPAAGDLVVLEGPEQDIYVLWARGTEPVQFIVTAGAVGEKAALYQAVGPARTLSAEDVRYPAAYVIDAAAASLDANGFLTIAGPPSILVMNHTDDFFHVVYAVVDGEEVRIK